MTSGIRTVIYPVKNLAKAKILYGNLVGAEPYMDEPYYVGFSVEGQDVGLDPHDHSQGMTGPVGYWHVDDIKESLKALLDAGAEAHQEVKDVGGGADRLCAGRRRQRHRTHPVCLRARVTDQEAPPCPRPSGTL